MEEIFTLLLLVFVVVGGNVCGPNEFPCNDGTCVDKIQWCDSVDDCPDDSDERYCARRTAFLTDPNRCSAEFFRCDDGKCIPLVGRCDGLMSCDDFSDEKNCTVQHSNVTHSTETAFEMTTHSTAQSPTAIHPSTVSPGIAIAIKHASPLPVRTENLAVKNVPVQSDAVHEGREVENGAKPANDIFDWEKTSHYFRRELSKAQVWLLSIRDANYGWKDDTARALTALHYGDDDLHMEEKMLMTKELHLQLSEALLRNSSDAISLSDLALYINALLATCGNPRNFHGVNLVEVLRHRTNEVQRTKFVSPLVYITLCMNGEGSYSDGESLRKEFHSNKNQLDKLGVLALATLAAVCHSRSPQLKHTDLHKYAAKTLLRKIEINGLPGNIYELALIFQALTEANLNGKLWKQSEALSQIRNSQLFNGSFGDILSTYYAMPVLAGSSLLHVHDHCPQKMVEGINSKPNSNKDGMYVQYSLYFGSPLEVSQTLMLKVPTTATLLEVMERAAQTNSVYRFKLEESKGTQNVYYIGNTANDAERGIYWTLYASADNVTADGLHLVELDKDIRSFVPSSGLHIVFWYKRLE